MAAKNSSPELRFGDWEDEDVDILLSSECQEGGRFANLQGTDLNKIVTESYSKSTKANTKQATKVFQGKYSVIEIHFRLQNSIKMDLIAVVRFLGVVFVHSDQFAFLCYILNPLEDSFPMSYKRIMHL